MRLFLFVFIGFVMIYGPFETYFSVAYWGCDVFYL
jgi:hypothetical protein